MIILFICRSISCCFFFVSVAGELKHPLEAVCMLVDSRLINHNLTTNLESWNKKLW